MAYKDHPGVKIILQEKARGKGYAVREGFERATGDVLMIQDADLEYDLNDYDALLEPVVNYKRPFVLGSRHGGRWKMRHFNEQEHISAYFNFGHKLFTTLINFLYGQKMKDPFTMFKVFRRDCLYNLKFECNRFDFDFELVIKLIRKGYTPLEIPVNYNSRSFKEGKKVNMFLDPFSWIKASFKYRFARITKDDLG
jgi:glycosyltransferase involved in cell wall biosynthesis